MPYVNAKPHIGHALECVQTDAIARFRKISGDDVYLTTGADENSLKNVQAAEKLGISTEELCKKNAGLFRELDDRIGLSYDIFVRSSVDAGHLKTTNALWDMCNKKGDIYKKEYSGLYCVGCEVFYTETELEGGMCPEHRTRPEVVHEENYFFRLSKYQDVIEKLVESNAVEIMPDAKKHEVLGFVRSGLEDFSISRSIKRSHGWGIPVPGDDSQIIYVWFDALGMYLTGAGFQSDNAKFEKLWPADMHVIGKGVIRFHAVYWLAMLLSAGLELPRSLLVHGYVTSNGQKMSKSIGNIVDPFEVIGKYGEDATRYYLLKEVSTFQDGDFSEKIMKELINNELVGNIGNFVNRTLSFIYSKFGGSIKPDEISEDGKDILNKVHMLASESEECMKQNQMNLALLRVLEISNLGNQYFQAREPWNLIKKDEESAEGVLLVCANISRALGILIYPHMPEASEKLLGYLNEKPQAFKNAEKIIKEFNIGEPKILFKKIDDA